MSLNAAKIIINSFEPIGDGFYRCIHLYLLVLLKSSQYIRGNFNTSCCQQSITFELLMHIYSFELLIYSRQILLALLYTIFAKDLHNESACFCFWNEWCFAFRCVTWNLPNICTLRDPAPGKCCKTPDCPSYVVIQYPPGYGPET